MSESKYMALCESRGEKPSGSETEEAYTALYQEFLHLRLLCFKQAAMLQRLTEALRQQQGRGEAQISTLAGEINGLQLDPVQDAGKPIPPHVAEPLDFPKPSRFEMTDILGELRELEGKWRSSQADKQTRRPWSSSFLTSEMLSEAGGMLMSRVTLQSQVCEFCHAVFPGHTTTRGEYLRHLNTHLS